MPKYKATVTADPPGSCRVLVSKFEVEADTDEMAVHAASAKFIGEHRVDPDVLTIDLEEI